MRVSLVTQDNDDDADDIQKITSKQTSSYCLFKVGLGLEFSICKQSVQVGHLFIECTGHDLKDGRRGIKRFNRKVVISVIWSSLDQHLSVHY